MSRPAFIQNTPLWDRIIARCEWVNGCLIWQGGKVAKGYGTIAAEPGRGGRKVYVHRVAYERVHGPVPDGLELDHVKARGCHSRACCNVDHLEAVTSKVNSLRGDSPAARNARKTHCPKGHPLEGANLMVRLRRGRAGRECRTCHLAGCLIRARRQRERQKGATHVA